MFAGHNVVGTWPLHDSVHLAIQQTRDIHIRTILFRCWPTIFDAGPTLKQHRVNDPCLLGISYQLLNCWRGYISNVLFTQKLDPSCYIYCAGAF